MRETSFIEQNKKKWDEFEAKFENETDPEKVSNLFIQITDDLSYARTYYPNRSVKIYLNNLSQKVFHSIYKNKVRRRRKFKTFWSDELPQKMHESRWSLLFTFSLFMIAFFIGIFSSMHDPDFARYILGDSYVRMTEENIASGDPMKVYKEMNQFDMFFGITFNNLRVAFITMIFGIFFGLGTSYFILYNGIMVGTFQYFFIERGLFWDSFLTIWVHGALEISAIVIAGTAGITLGRGLLFPGTYTRGQSFRINGLRAVQIFLGIAPIIVLAGINESFLTRYTETPDFVRALLIIVEFGFMLFYFVIYPARKAKKGFSVNRKSDEIPFEKMPEVKLNKIKTNGVIFADSFIILRQFFWPILTVTLSLALAYTGFYFWQIVSFSDVYHEIQIVRVIAIFESITDVNALLNYDNIFLFTDYGTFSGFTSAGYLFLLNAFSLALVAALSFYILLNIKLKQLKFNWAEFGKFILNKGWFILITCLLLHSILLIDYQIANFMFYLLIPILFFICADMILHKRPTFNSYGKIQYLFKQFLNIQLLFLPLLLLSIMMACIGHSLLSFFNIELIKWNIPFDALVYEAFQDLSITLIIMFTIFIQLAMIAINMGIMFLSFEETESATDLNERLTQLVNKKNTIANS